MQPKLRQQTLNLLKERPRHRTLARISMDTGIPFFWLEHFSKGRTKNPNCDTVEKLYIYLTGRELEL